MSDGQLDTHAAGQECQSLPTYSQAEVLVSNLPYIAMTVLGAAVFAVGPAGSAWKWVATGAYLVYGAAGALWVMIFICPYCHFWDTRACPCGYGRIAAKLREKKDGERFKEKFRRHIPVIAPLWFIPALAGVFMVLRSFSWPVLALLLVFAVDAFIILPLVSTKHGCAACPQKDLCPWMGRKA